jgi:hypothetical protein
MFEPAGKTNVSTGRHAALLAGWNAEATGRPLRGHSSPVRSPLAYGALPAALVVATVLMAACGGSTQLVPDDGAAPLDAAETSVDACAATTVDLVPDAAPGTCAFTPADVACNTASDCKVLLRLDCACYVPAVGVNVDSTAACLPPPCTPPPADGGCESTGYITQDCAMVGSINLVGVGCVDHQCRTFVIIPG